MPEKEKPRSLNTRSESSSSSGAKRVSEHLEKRRRVVKRIVSGGGVVAGAGALSSGWQKPVIDSVLLPAHAQSSPSISTTAALTTTPTFNTSTF